MAGNMYLSSKPSSNLVVTPTHCIKQYIQPWPSRNEPCMACFQCGPVLSVVFTWTHLHCWISTACPNAVTVGRVNGAAGHSLGGALATLAAFDLVRSCKSLNSSQGPATDPICYTFGAPRLGNHAFAHLFNTTVPNTWHVINDQVSCWSSIGPTLLRNAMVIPAYTGKTQQ